MSHPEIMDTRLKSPFTAMAVGPTGCGKTELLLSLIANAKRVANPHPIEIDYCYGMWQERFGRLTGVNFHKSMIDVEDRYKVGGKNRWLIIDDLADELVGTKELNKLFTKHSYHLNVSVSCFRRTCAKCHSTVTTCSCFTTRKMCQLYRLWLDSCTRTTWDF